MWVKKLCNENLGHGKLEQFVDGYCRSYVHVHAEREATTEQGKTTVPIWSEEHGGMPMLVNYRIWRWQLTF